MIDYKVQLCKRIEIEKFIEKYHYSGSINGVSSIFCFKLMDKGLLIGGAIFGWLAMENQYKKYANSNREIIELRRLALIDNTKKNSESYFIARCLKWINRNTDIKKVISYADQNYNHSGIIYKASNFEYLGLTDPTKAVEWNGKIYHNRTASFKKGRNNSIYKQIKKALESGEAKKIELKPKHIFLYTFKKNKQIKPQFTFNKKSKKLDIFLKKKSLNCKLNSNRVESVKNSKKINILEFNMNLSKKQLDMIKVCSQMDNSLRYALYHRIELYDCKNEWLKYLKNW